MKRQVFEKELAKRFEENKRLSQRQFLPKSVGAGVATASEWLFYLMVVGALLITLLGFKLFDEQVLTVSKRMLLLQ